MKEQKLKVMKFGGTSLKSVITREYVYAHVMKYTREYKIILVVSAQGRYPNAFATDTLLSYASDKMSKEEQAWLASIGEQYSALRVCSELLEKNLRVKAVNYIDAGIITDDKYEYANLKKLDASKISEYLKDYDILVVGGFLGVNETGKVTTLGRGGSDYSAVLFAQMMNLPCVEIYSDVDGVYDSNPNLNKNAKKYQRLSYDDMLNLKSRVLHDRCVDYAKVHHIKVHLLGTFSENEGTYIE
ncbi:MAG: aspartate kinase [Erysipelotrichia bacterium]|nr:aspartate kinase [Erysipelotrichia bacterium]NCC55499.1 aspartate kinase [Erysipelotrichia bacterium]